jgi:DNA-binding MarR family transcriptional regulator
MPKLSARKQRMRDVSLILYYMDTIQRRVQRQHLSSIQSSMQQVGDEYQDLTVVQVQVLKSVMAHQPITIKRLAELRNITSSAATQAVDTLANKGMVQRVQDENDRRSTLISLTPGYQERVTDFMGKLGTSFDTVFSVLTDKELSEYARLCGKIVEEGENS